MSSDQRVMEQGTKRKSEQPSAGAERKAKSRKQWRVPRHGDSRNDAGPRTIEPGDSGIWATCHRGKEGKCVGELRDLFAEHAEKLYGSNASVIKSTQGEGDEDVDNNNTTTAEGIENEIEAEIAGMHRPPPGTRQCFVPVKLNVQCVVFFKTLSPIEPVAFVRAICEDAQRESHRKRTRFVQRLTPMTRMGRASVEGLDKIATEVLGPYFHQQPFQKRKFAIRPSLRNHNILNREGVIQQVATIVGKGHEVDLKNYDLLILIEIYQNVCGIAVVDNSFEKLKRFNLAELFDPGSGDTGQGSREGHRIEAASSAQTEGESASSGQAMG